MSVLYLTVMSVLYLTVMSVLYLTVMSVLYLHVTSVLCVTVTSVLYLTSVVLYLTVTFVLYLTVTFVLYLPVNFVFDLTVTSVFYLTVASALYFPVKSVVLYLTVTFVLYLPVNFVFDLTVTSVFYLTVPSVLYLPATSALRGWRGSNEELTADFRAHLGLLDGDEDTLTDVFKATIGLLGEERVSEVSEVELAITEERDETLSSFQYKKFAKQYFIGGNSSVFSTEALSSPLLPKTHKVDKMAAMAVWLAILRYMGEMQAPTPATNTAHADKVPIMTKIYMALDRRLRRNSRKGSTTSTGSTGSAEEDQKDITSFKLSKRRSWKKIFSHRNSSKKHDLARSNSENGREFDYSTDMRLMLDMLPTSQMELIHFIVGHGILRRELRDEIFCQLCKQLSGNPSDDSMVNGWALMAFCTGCFKPSDQFRKHLKSFLYAVVPEFKDHASYAHRLLRRTSTNGTRFHPPNFLEIQATKARQYVLLPVTFANDRVESVEADAATTSTEVVAKLANKIGLKDTFGFSIFVAIFHKVSSLGSGLDHLMDAISECEQVARTKGIKEEDASWRLFLRKELFAPWEDPGYDEVAASLIYDQICKGVRSMEYGMPAEDEMAAFVAQRFYVEHGPALIPGKVQTALEKYLPRKVLSGSKSREGWVQAIISSFNEQGLSDSKASEKEVKERIATSASQRWPVHFSALFVAFRLSGPRLPKNEVVVAVSGEGFYVMDQPFRVIVEIGYYELVEVFSSRTSKMHGQSFSLITVKGDEFTFASPNAHIITQLLSNFLDGLRRRSIYAVGLEPFVGQKIDGADTDASAKPFRFRQGDLIILIDDIPGCSKKEDWTFGKCVRNGSIGQFPFDLVYILPAIRKPPQDFVECFSNMSNQNTETLPRKKGSVFLTKGTVGRCGMHGKDSAA
ncbi:Myosin-VIIa [Lamellibrachia satsuma]|nr:Myosin-VIIa [Lamellibrachia satsuma]